MITKTKDIGELKFAEYNPRQLTNRQFQDLKNSITEFGFVEPVLINKNKDRENIIIGGHQRVRVAKNIGISKIPCVEVDLSYNKERELNIRLNKNTGDWDYDVLADEFDMDELIDWGFKEGELVGFSAEEEEPKKIDNYKLKFNLSEEVYMLWIQWVTRAGLMTGDKSDEVALQFALTEVLKLTNDQVN